MVSEHLAVDPAFSPNSIKHTPQCPIANVLVHSRQEPALPLHLLFTLLLLCWQLALGVQQHMPPVLLTKVVMILGLLPMALKLNIDILERQGIEVQYSTAAEFGRLMSDDRQRWSRLVKEAGVVLR